MLEEELRRPLRRRSSLDRLWASKPSPLTAACLGLTLTVAGAVFWLARQHDPNLGEPVVHLRIEPVDPRTTASTTPAEATPPESALDEDPAPPGEVVIEGLETTVVAASQAHAGAGERVLRKRP